jgi:hypothetical protein
VAKADNAATGISDRVIANGIGLLLTERPGWRG